MIEVKDIAFSYGKHPVLKGISLTAAPGDCVGILGNNGAGKSTFITCLNRIRRPERGEVHIDGADVLTMSLK